MENSKSSRGFGEKGKRGRPSTKSKINPADETEDVDAQEVDDDGNDDNNEDNSFNDNLESELNKTTVNIPNANGEINTDDIKFDDDKGFNDIPDEEFDLLGEATTKRSYASGGGAGTNESATAQSEEPIPEPKYAEMADSGAGYKNEFTDASYTESGKSNAESSQGKNKEQVQAEKERQKAEKEEAKANSNVKDLTPEQKREAAAKTSEMAVELYATYRPMPFVHFGSHNKKKLQKEHDDKNIDLQAEIRGDGTTLENYVDAFNADVEETFTVREETKAQLKEALYDVLMEKEIALTPTQRLAGLVVLDIVGCVVATVKLVGQKSSDMEQFRQHHAEKMEEIRSRMANNRAPHYTVNPQPAPPPPKPAATPNPPPEQSAQPATKKAEAAGAIQDVAMTMEDVLKMEYNPEQVTVGHGDIPLSPTEEVEDGDEAYPND